MNGTLQIAVYDRSTGETRHTACNADIRQEAGLARQVENGVVCLYPGFKGQLFQGYGCAMTETACYLLSRLPQPERERALRCWFSRDGMDAAFIRIPIDSCDYSLEEYQAVADPIADPELNTFTIDRDRKYILPMVKEALSISERPLRVLMSPWSPPWQWKTPPEVRENDAATYGGAAKGVDFSKPGRCFGGRLKPEYYASWAKYLVKYLQAYLDEGIPVAMLSVQNEAGAATNWDSCLWTGREEAVFLRDHLYPAMRAAGLTDQVGVYVWDHNKERMIEHIEELMEEGVGDLVQGFAYHWYSGDHFEALSLLGRKYPGKVLMHSESCGLHVPGKALAFEPPEGAEIPGWMRALAEKPPLEVDLEDASHYAHDILGDLNHGMERWIDWNLMVDRAGGPRHVSGGFAAPLVYEEAGTVTRTVSYEWLRLMAQTLCAGSRMIGVSRFGTEVDAAAAERPDGSIGVVLLGRSGKQETVYVRVGGQLVTVELPPDALAALTLRKEEVL